MISEAQRAKQAARRLVEARAKHYRSARAAALDNGWPESTYRAHETNSRVFGIDDAVKYARRYGADPLALYYGALGSDGKTKNLSGSLPIKGEVRAGAWLEADDQWQHDESTIPVGPDSRYPDQQYALRVVGDSMNKVFAEGQYVVCASLAEIGRHPLQDELVIVERHRAGLIEVTVKRFDMSSGEPILRPESTNKVHVPIRLNDQSAETEIYITGLVIGRYEQF